MRWLMKFAVAFGAVIGFSASAQATIFTGVSTNRASVLNPVNATALPADQTWAQQGVILEWTVTQNGDGSWNYSYSFTRPNQGALSHIIIELSTGVTANDLMNLTVTGSTLETVTVDTHLPQQGNPDMPGSIYGVKFDVDNDALTSTISFDIFRDPVWGDWYAKDGVFGQAWNLGFTASDTDPDGPPANTADLLSTDARYMHILRPDTVSTVIPEPSTIAMALTALVPLGFVGLRRLRRRPDVDSV
jgi:hypothetical protein